MGRTATGHGKQVPEAAGQVADTGVEDGRGKKVGAAGHELALQVPAVDTAWSGLGKVGGGCGAVACPGYNVKVVCLLESGEERWTRSTLNAREERTG